MLRPALYRLARRRAMRRPAAAGAAALDPAASGWRATVGAVVALVRAGRGAEADRLIERALAAFPDDPSFLVEHALNAHFQGSHREAISRYERACAAAPSEPLCYFGRAGCLRSIGETAAAERVIAEGRRRFPKNTWVAVEAAHIAEARGRFADASALWTPLMRRPDPPPEWVRGHVHALILLGRFVEAEAVLARALARHPDSRILRAVEGILASSREDWPRAVALWAAYRSRFPDDRTGWEHHGRAVEGLALKAADDRLAGEPAKGPVLVAPAKVDIVDDDEMRSLMLGFESIGDICEFGSVQRRYGAEPLGLLRWNDVHLDNLIAALADRFAGMGEPENTEMPVVDNGEFIVRDKRWDLWTHTFQFVGQVEPDVLFPKMCRRIAYLRDKLIEDLGAAEKIFVYRTPMLSAARLDELQTALDAYGPIKLLAVLPARTAGDFTGEAGDIVEVGARCWVGFLSRLGIVNHNQWDIAYDDWVSICRKTSEAAEDRRLRSLAPPPAA